MADILTHLHQMARPLRQVSIPAPVAIGLGSLVFANLLFKSNKYLSKRALNSFVENDIWEWQREIVVVTGGSSGIGAAIIKSLAKHGIKTISLDVSAPHEDTQAENLFFYEVDLTDPEQIASVAERVRLEHGAPTVLISNAGTQSSRSILDISDSQLRTTFDLNILASFRLVKEFLPAMVSRNHGHIMTVASLATFATRAVNVDYACTKSALLSFHEGLGQELQHIYHTPGVRTSIVHPGWVRTPLIEEMVKSGVIKGHLLEPDDVSEAIVQQILSGTGAQLFLPSGFWILSLLRMLPSWLQERIRDLLTTTRGYTRR